MKWQYWLLLEVLIEFSVIAWIYFFPSDDNVGNLARAMLGFSLIYCIEVIRKKED